MQERTGVKSITCMLAVPEYPHEKDTIYRITAICDADNSRASVDLIFVKEGKNELSEDKMLILAVHKPTPAIEDTSKGIDPGKGKVIPENP